MSQFDMVLTQWAFIGAALTRPKSIGLSDISAMDLTHLTKQMYVVGKELGIADTFNLCLGSLEEIIQYAKDIEYYVIQPALESDNDFQSMAKYLLEGVNILNPFIDPLAFASWTHRLFGAKNSNLKRVSQLVSYIRL